MTNTNGVFDVTYTSQDYVANRQPSVFSVDWKITINSNYKAAMPLRIHYSSSKTDVPITLHCAAKIKFNNVTF